MKRLLILPIFIFTINHCIGQTSLLQNYEFEEGGYLLLATRITATDSLANTIGDFYIDDMKTLEEIKEDWLSREIELLDDAKRSGTYYIYICKNQTSKHPSFEVGLNDKYILTYEGFDYFLLEPEQLLKYQSKFKKAVEKKEKFSSLEKARKYYSSIIGNDKLIYSPIPEWVSYEGSFSFIYACNKGDCPFKENIEDNIAAQIKKVYPDEPFELKYTSGSLSAMEDGTFTSIYTTNCNKTLAQKFNLYPTGNRYEDFHIFEITTYWKEKN